VSRVVGSGCPPPNDTLRATALYEPLSADSTSSLTGFQDISQGFLGHLGEVAHLTAAAPHPRSSLTDTPRSVWDMRQGNAEKP
jgi:hypothetical protein